MLYAQGCLGHTRTERGWYQFFAMPLKAYGRGVPGHANLLDEPTVFEDTSKHKLIHCGPDVANIYRAVGLQGER